MPEEEYRPKRHFVLPNAAQSENFTPRTQNIKTPVVPRQNRQEHGQRLINQIDALKPAITQANVQQTEMGLEDGLGLQIEFESFPDIKLAFESLSAESSGIELLNVRHDDTKTLAAVFVPDGKLRIFENKIAAYLDESKDSVSEDRETRSPKNQKLLDAIHNIRVASIRSLWTDDPEVFPSEMDENFWWEVWLPVRGDRSVVVGQFKQLATRLNFRVANGQIEFPERTVVQIYGSLEQMQRSMLTLNSIAELRRAKETADFFDSLPPDEQPEWVDELLERALTPADGADVPHVCLLDTGVANAHPLLAPVLSGPDVHTVEPGWGVDDQEGHGTEMAGLAIWGDISPSLEVSSPIEVLHRLESVKLLNMDHSNGGDPQYHGYLTAQAVSRPEISAPERKRVFSMSVTARDARDRGKPSAWSATIDRLSVDYENQGETPRLFTISAGNIGDPNAWAASPVSNSTDAIHDPGQAWNALTVGASTDLDHITGQDTEGYHPIAPAGGLSPFSTTSQTWQSHWPLKPDIVFEGGNAANDGFGAVTMPCLSLLTTNAKISERLFTTTNATSAATALTARMAARLMAKYPELRIETIRGLIVHSAEWTPTMKQQFLASPTNPTKGQIAELVRHCGFGQPNLDRALWSVENSLTLICEDSLRPYMREGSNNPKLRDMNLHRLPWPLDELEKLGEVEVEMRVTLSYFIEPNPSARGVSSRYRYESHGLRFDVKRQYESDEEFRQRINVAARDADEGTGTTTGDDPQWVLGTQNRHRGSLHSDIWKGPAADLASRGVLAIFPVSGWWKTRPKLERYDQLAPYSLLVSIRAPGVDVALYTEIENKIGVFIEM